MSLGLIFNSLATIEIISGKSDIGCKLVLDKKNEQVNISSYKSGENCTVLLDNKNGKIEIKAKDADITISKDGSVNISSKKTVIKASDELELSSDTLIKIKSADIKVEGKVEVKGTLDVIS